MPTASPMPTGMLSPIEQKQFRREYAEMVAQLAEKLTRETRGPQQPWEIGPRERF